MDISNLVKTMNRIEDHDSGGMFECLAFVDNTIAAFELSEADNSASNYVKDVFSESADRAIETALMTEYDQIQIMFESADYFNEKSDNFIVRAWEKFKGWIKSFWNWITRKKDKSSSDKATKLAKGTTQEHEVRLAIAYRKKTSLELGEIIKKLEKKVTKINLSNMSADKKKKANEAVMSAIKVAMNVVAEQAKKALDDAAVEFGAKTDEERAELSKHLVDCFKAQALKAKEEKDKLENVDNQTVVTED